MRTRKVGFQTCPVTRQFRRKLGTSWDTKTNLEMLEKANMHGQANMHGNAAGTNMSKSAQAADLAFASFPILPHVADEDRLNALTHGIP